MRGNTFAGEMASRAATRVDVLPSQANAGTAIDGMAWEIRMRIIEANLGAFSGQPKREFLPPCTPSHRKTRQQKRNELLETSASMEQLIKRRWSRCESYRCARCGRAGCLQRWKFELTACSAVLARHDDRWVEESTMRVHKALAEKCSADEDPFSHGGALDAEEEESDRNERTGHDSPEEYHTNKLVLGNGVVHHSHETCLLRGTTFCGNCGAWGSSAPRLLTKPCTYSAKTRACDLRRLSRGRSQTARRFGRATRHWCLDAYTSARLTKAALRSMLRYYPACVEQVMLWPETPNPQDGTLVTGTQGRDASQTLKPLCIVSTRYASLWCRFTSKNVTR